MAGLDNGFPRPLWLYVFVQRGCGACAEAAPHLYRLKAQYPLKVIVVELHLDSREWTEVLEWTPKYTPGYALVDRDGADKTLIKKATGTMTFEQLVAWIGQENLT